jgi:hypothetical protein
VTHIGNIIAQLEQERTAIDRALSALREIGGSRTSPPIVSKARRRRGRLSAEGRQRIADAARKRWALKRAAEGGKKASTKK